MNSHDCISIAAYFNKSTYKLHFKMKNKKKAWIDPKLTKHTKSDFIKSGVLLNATKPETPVYTPS